jgi:type I restriction enzyme S subunit
MNFDNLPNGWQVKRLGEICNIVGGGTPKRDDPTFWGGNIVWVTPKELPSDSLIEIRNSENTITQKGLKYSSAKLLPVGSVIYSSRATVGKIAFAAVPLATNQGFANLICNDRVYNRYLALCLRWLTPEIQRLAGQTTFPEVKKSDLKQFQIPLPPLDEQHRIVARIEELTSRIEEAKGLRLSAQKETEAIMPATLANVFTVRNEWAAPHMVEDGLCRIIPGQHIMSKDYANDQKGIPYITGPADFGSKFPIITKWTSAPKAFAEPGDVLLTVKGAGVGKVNCAPGIKVSIGRQVMALRPEKSRLGRDYLYFFLSENLNYFQKTAQSATVPGLRKEQVGKMRIPLPPLDEQRCIAAYLDSLQAKVQELCRLQEEAQREIEATIAAVLDRAFRGKL